MVKHVMQFFIIVYEHLLLAYKIFSCIAQTFKRYTSKAEDAMKGIVFEV